jgi:RNA polymerase sigma-70 factor (ECF subfamily)
MAMSSKGGAAPEDLLVLARQDKVALGELLEQYRSYLTLLVRAQIGRGLQSKVDPADLIQDTFLEVHRTFAAFRGSTEGEFVGWLRQILASHLAMLVRRYYGSQRRDIRLERQLALELDESSRVLDEALAAPHTSPSRQAARRELAVLLAQALEGLPPDYREVLILRHLEGLGFAEVARRMGRSTDSVQKLWSRALPRLRRSLEGVR